MFRKTFVLSLVTGFVLLAALCVAFVPSILHTTNAKADTPLPLCDPVAVSLEISFYWEPDQRGLPEHWYFTRTSATGGTFVGKYGSGSFSLTGLPDNTGQIDLTYDNQVHFSGSYICYKSNEFNPSRLVPLFRGGTMTSPEGQKGVWYPVYG